MGPNCPVYPNDLKIRLIYSTAAVEVLMNNLRGRMRILMMSNIASWGLVVLLTLTGFTEKARTRFAEIDVERVNIIGADGKPALVLSNRRLIPGPSINGKDYPRALADGREVLSGMIFF